MRRIVFLFMCGVISTPVWAENPQATQAERSRSTFLIHIINYSRFESTPDFLKLCFIENPQKIYFNLVKQDDSFRSTRYRLSASNLDSVADAVSHRCDYVFIDKHNETAQTFADIEQLPETIVTVGETASFIRNGGLVSLVEESDKIRIYLNRTLYNDSAIKFSARLLKYVNFIR